MLTFPLKLIAIVRWCVNVIEVQLCTFIQLVREKRTFAVVECETDIGGCELLLRLLAVSLCIVWGRWKMVFWGGPDLSGLL